MDKGDTEMVQNVLCGALIYIIVGVMIWLQMNTENSIQKKIDGKDRLMPFKFLKTVAFWGSRMVSNHPSPEWMCK